MALYGSVHVETETGVLDLGPTQPRREAGKLAKLVVLTAVVTFCGFAAVVTRSGLAVDGQVRAVEDGAIRDVPDCQCLGICNTPDSGHDGTWCYINSQISPCTDSTKRVIYGQEWARCAVIYGDDDCSGNPCQNSAICVDKYDGYECVCRAGWSGTDCSTEVNVEYTIKLTTSDDADSGTENGIFFQFTGTEGDSSGSEELAFRGIGRSERGASDNCPSDNADNPGYKQATMVAKDVGELHKVTYKVADDDSLDPAIIQVEFKGEVYVAVGDLPKSEYAKAVSVTMVKGREYSLTFGTTDSPDWAATANDIYVQLTGADWQVSGAVVAFPTGMNDGVTCTTNFYAADVGAPAKITYWVRNDDSVLPSTIVVDNRYKAEVTAGDQCYGASFTGDSDTGSGYAFADPSCTAGDGEGCTNTNGCRWCSLWDPDTSQNEVLCPWVLPYSDGRFIIIDLVDLWDSTTVAAAGNSTTTAAAAATTTTAAAR
jgi:hypothetical protein